MPTKALTGFALLKQPFDKSVVEHVTKKMDGKTKTFPNVDPKHYMDRLNEAFPNPGDYNLEFGNPLFAGGKAVAVNCKLTFYPGTDAERILAANGAQSIKNSENGDEVAYAVKGAQSDALKLALKPTGLGRELYDLGVDEEVDEEVEEDEEADEKPARKTRSTTRTRTRSRATEEEDEEEEDEAPPAKSRTRSTGSKGGSDWADLRKKFTLPMGKNKGTKYSELEQSYLTWANDKLDPDDAKYGESNAKILKCIQSEIKYRKENDLWEAASRGSNKPKSKRRVDEDDDEDAF